MSQKIDLPKRPKTGGRKKGTPNKANVRVRDLFLAKGFNFADQVMDAFSQVQSPAERLEFLLRLAPYFMQRLREESEETPTPDPIDVTPDLSDVPRNALVEIAKKTK